jgi:DNA-binding transcriptional MerR regulator
MQGTSTSLTVGQLARRSGLTVRALHHYDAIGLLTPSQRSDSGYRLYVQADVARLYRIQALQRLGLSLADIAAALDRDGTSLQHIVAQQIAELDDQIQQSSRLRAQLQGLHQRLSDGNEPALADWLAALELIATYDKYCSSEELNTLVTHHNDATAPWREFIDDVRGAMRRGLAPDSTQAAELARRWTSLAMNRFGGDPELAKKMKQIYYQDGDIQARVQAQSGFDVAMMEYLGQAVMHWHLGLWSRHLSEPDVRRLRLQDVWAGEWIATASAMRREMSAGTATDGAPVQALLHRWDALIDEFAGGDATLRRSVAAALKTDAELQYLWSISSELQDFVDGARAVRQQ